MSRVGKRLQREGELLHLWLRDDRLPAAVADAVAAGKLGYLSPDRLRVLGSKVGAPSVEPLVVVQLLGVVARERFEEVLSGTGPEEEQVRPDSARARLASRADDLLELLGAVGDPRAGSAPSRRSP